MKSKCGVVLLAVFCSDYELSVPSEEILSDDNYLFGRFLVFSCECCSPVALLVVAVMTHSLVFASDQLVPWVFPFLGLRHNVANLLCALVAIKMVNFLSEFRSFVKVQVAGLGSPF